MRARPNQIKFVEFLRKFGNNSLNLWKYHWNTQQLIWHNKNKITNEVYGNISEIILSEIILKSVVILAPKNDDCNSANTDILNRIRGERNTYYCYDKIICDNDNEINDYSVEFVNSLSISVLPPHKLGMKVNCLFLVTSNN